MTKFGREKSSSLSRQETGALPPSLSSQHDTTSSQKCCCAFGEPKPRFFSLRIPPMKKGFRWKEGRRVGRRCEIFHFGEPGVKKKLPFLRSRRGEGATKKNWWWCYDDVLCGKTLPEKEEDNNNNVDRFAIEMASTSVFFVSSFCRGQVFCGLVGLLFVVKGRFHLKWSVYSSPTPWPSKRQTVKRSEGAY